MAKKYYSVKASKGKAYDDISFEKDEDGMYLHGRRGIKIYCKRSKRDS